MMSNSSLSFELRRQGYLARTAGGAGAKASPECSVTDGQLLQQIVARRELTAVFQPIVDLAQGEIFGFEGLIRGPAGSPLHSPLKLLSAAESRGIRVEVEHLARQVTLERYRDLDLPGRLFLNASPACLLQPGSVTSRTLEFIRDLGINPAQVVIELTENQPTFDFELMRAAARHYRQLGFAIAIDDLGEGFSSLRLWSELRPEFVKIDRHFIQNVDSDDVKRQFLQSIQQIATGAGCKIIAEGVETAAEFAAVVATGIALGQGYWFAPPQPVPAPILPESVQIILSRSRQRDGGGRGTRHAPSAAQMIRAVPIVSDSATTEDVYALFESHPDLQSLPVVRDNEPLGLISRASLIDRYARPFRREIYGRKPCTIVMDSQPLLVEASTSLQDLSFMLAQAEQRHLAVGFIVVERGCYLGFGSGHDVVREITRLQIEAARHTNPLSGLPGNLPLNERIDVWLDEHSEFFACYCDLDHFKPFNDVYGYSRGDDLIRLLADILRSHADPLADFIGHIGGDDFMVLFGSSDWEERCERILKHFARSAGDFFSAADRQRGGYVTESRSGQAEFVPLTSLSLGVVHVESKCFSAYHQVAAAAAVAKKEAKKIAGNSIFVERRHSGAPAARIDPSATPIAVPPAPTFAVSFAMEAP